MLLILCCESNFTPMYSTLKSHCVWRLHFDLDYSAEINESKNPLISQHKNKKKLNTSVEETTAHGAPVALGVLSVLCLYCMHRPSPPAWGCWRSPGEAWRPCTAAWRTSSGCWTSDRRRAAGGSTASPSSSPRPRRATPPRSDWWRWQTSSVGRETQTSQIDPERFNRILIFISSLSGV